MTSYLCFLLRIPQLLTQLYVQLYCSTADDVSNVIAQWKHLHVTYSAYYCKNKTLTYLRLCKRCKKKDNTKQCVRCHMSTDWCDVSVCNTHAWDLQLYVSKRGARPVWQQYHAALFALCVMSLPLVVGHQTTLSELLQVFFVALCQAFSVHSCVQEWGRPAKVLVVDKIPLMVFVVLFVSLSAIYRVGLSGSIDVLICFQSSSSAPFLKSKIDMFSAAVPPPLCFSSVWDWSRSIAETCFTSCCAVYNYRSRISGEDYS